MKLVIDLDGVLADFTLAFTTKMHESDPSVKVVSAPQQQTYNFQEASRELFNKTFDWVKASPCEFNANLELLIYPSDVGRLVAIAEKHEVYYATNRFGGVEALRGTKTFLANRLAQSGANVVLTHKKGEFARAIGATHAIDDKAGNANAIVEYTRDLAVPTKSFLLDRPYNRFDHSNIASKVIRISSFTEFLNAVEADA